MDLYLDTFATPLEYFPLDLLRAFVSGSVPGDPRALDNLAAKTPWPGGPARRFWVRADQTTAYARMITLA